MRRSRMTSITSQVRRSVTSIAVLLAVPAIIGLAVMLMYSSRTQAMIRRNRDGISKQFEVIERLKGVRAQLKSLQKALDTVPTT